MNIDEIEDLVSYNNSYGISIKHTLQFLNRLDLLDYFTTS
jgi:hypothetical protein